MKRCTVHFYRNVFSHVPKVKVGDVAHTLKAIHPPYNAIAQVWLQNRIIPNVPIALIADLIRRLGRQSRQAPHLDKVGIQLSYNILRCTMLVNKCDPFRNLLIKERFVRHQSIDVSLWTFRASNQDRISECLSKDRF